MLVIDRLLFLFGVPSVPPAAWAKLFEAKFLPTRFSTKCIVVVVRFFTNQKDDLSLLLFSTFRHSAFPVVSETNSLQFISYLSRNHTTALNYRVVALVKTNYSLAL